MKKSLALFCLLAATLFGFQANAELWLIGAISPAGWSTNDGAQFSTTDSVNYTLDLDVTNTGNQYYSLTTKLSTTANDWDGIKPYRFGGNMEVALDTETELVAGTDQSPYTNFSKAGVYTFTFNIETKKIKVVFKEDVVMPTFNGTIYIDKASIGNIWAWDNGGNYFNAWPGKEISTLETATVNGTEYYSFTYSHNESYPGLIFNEGSDGPQTSNLVPEDGKVYFYTGGTNVTITDPNEPATTPDLYLFGPAAQGWNPTAGDIMTYNETTQTYSISITPEAPTSFSFTTKLAENENDWNAIAAYRWGADTDGNDFVFNENYLDSTLTLIQTDQPGHAFAVPAGSYTLTVDLNNKTLVISGTVTPVEPEETKVYILGNVAGAWDPAMGQEMTTEDGVNFTATLNAIDNGDGNAYFAFTNKLGTWDEIAAYRFGAVSENDYWVTAENISDTINLVYGGQTIRIPAGEYTLNLNLQSMKLFIGGEIVVPVDTAQVFILGNVAGEWNPAVGQEMTTEDGVIYTANLNAIDNGDGHAYFSFTKKLGTWDEIADYRFGAVSEGNYWVENACDTIPLVNNGQSIRVDVGEYDLTVNLNEMTLVINKIEHTATAGDANEDGKVDVNDVTTVINYILKKNPSPFNYDNANVNGDDTVSVMDVTLIIDMILHPNNY
jgi:hypothetical protein